MTIDEVIKILTAWKETGESEDSEALEKAELMGIEALKRLKALRADWSLSQVSLLPGETEE